MKMLWPTRTSVVHCQSIAGIVDNLSAFFMELLNDVIFLFYKYIV